ncbi:MAG: hypothetical protein NUV48_06910 [Peptococcaceae bacterium]|nr:hypothetical protein [Peptococcaceae bacterium]
MGQSAVFEVAYEGPAVVDGTMDVRELAPSLLALGNLIENVNRVIGDPEAQVKVVVKSSFQRGSFQITLEVIYKWVEQVKLLFDIGRAENLAETLLSATGFAAFAGISLIELLQRLRGRKVKSATILENGNTRLELTGENGQFDCIGVQDKVIKLYRDRLVRENLRRLLKPLERQGVDGFSVRKGEKVVHRITRDEVGYYDVPEVPEQERTNVVTRKMYVNLVEVAFEEGLKWRLSDGDNKFYATIADESFLSQVDAGKSFKKGDVLEIEMETTQVATSRGGIKNEHRVLKVVKHLSRPEQIPLFANEK